MNRLELVKVLAEKTNSTQKAVKELLDVMQEITYAEMAAEGEVKIFDGVTLVGVKKEARTARNPITGAAVEVPEKIAPKAKFGKAAKDAVAGK